MNFNHNWCNTDDIIKYGKQRIERKDMIGLKGMLQEVHVEEPADYGLNHAYIYKSLFLHSCLKGNSEIIIFLITIYFDFLSLCDRLALRQNVFYGKYLLPKSNKTLIKWYNDFVIPIFRLKE